MKFQETGLKGLYIIELGEIGDERGFFARSWCKKEFDAHGLNTQVVQANISFNRLQGTLRGMHYQRAPYAETKLIRCTKGALFDVTIDLRTDSDTYKQWFGVELTEENYKMLYVPEGFANGFQTLVDNTEIFYQVTEFYMPDAEGGARYDDPAFSIKWKVPVSTISDKDVAWPDYKD